MSPVNDQGPPCPGERTVSAIPAPMGDHRKLVDLVARCAQEQDRPLIVAIDGKSGAGKSTLTGIVARQLDASVIEGDDFYAGGIGLRNDTPAARAAACIDWQAQRLVLDNLRQRRRACWHPFDWEAFDGSQRTELRELEPCSIILLEGTWSARPELADLLDLRILVAAPDGVRHSRLLAREGDLGPWERQWHKAEDHYFATIMPEDSFDLVVRN